MIIIFEGCRNSGKTFLSKKVSEALSIERFQFDFTDYLSSLNIGSRGSKSAHFFAVGKDLMLMQLNRDGFIQRDVIIDRGFLTVFAWGLVEKRTDLSNIKNQIKLLSDKGLTSGVSVIYIEGENPDKIDRKKDVWDPIEKTGSEKVSYEIAMMEMESRYPDISITRFKNNFDQQSVNDLIRIVKNVRNNTNN